MALQLELSTDRETLHVDKVEAQTNPEKWQQLIANPPTQKAPLRFSMPTPEYDDLVIATLHSAFLELFYTFGYSYVLNRNTKPVHQLLMGKAEPEHFRSMVRKMTKPDRAPTDIAESPLILFQPCQFCCFLVLLPFPQKGDTFRAVALPGFRNAGESGYENLLESQELPENSSVQRIVNLPDFPDRLTDGEHKYLAGGIWDHIVEDGE